MDRQSQMVLSNLINTQQIVSLGTLDNGEPVVSMVAYTVADDFSKFYIHISGLAKHTKNIVEKPNVGLLICEAARPGEDPQTLARISISGVARMVLPDSKEFEEIKAGYIDKYRQSEVNFELGDFSMYAIESKSARFVAGFGKIFNLTEEGLAQASKA